MFNWSCWRKMFRSLPELIESLNHPAMLQLESPHCPDWFDIYAIWQWRKSWRFLKMFQWMKENYLTLCWKDPNKPSRNEAMAAVKMLLLHRTSACRRLIEPSGTQPTKIETIAARKPTTMACNWTRTRFPSTRLFNAPGFSIVPIFAYSWRWRWSIIDRFVFLSR